MMLILFKALEAWMIPKSRKQGGISCNSEITLKSPSYLH